ncbi:MAG TPA: helix-turn-helix transcriptional regulator [Polyangiaceae bacterium]|nr:helix-turn-helix transcriptional regulator [Polyangiaceae bacterium]
MLLTTREVAEVLRVHPKHVYRLMRRGLPASRVGDAWRFDEAAVLAWARARSPGRAPGTGRPAEPGPAPGDDGERAPPAHVAANGDVAIELVLEALWRAPGPRVGFVRADHGAGIELLRRRAVLLCGFHEGNALPTFDDALARVHVVEREIGVAFAPGGCARGLAELAGERFATRPPSAGVRAYLDAALRREGVEPAAFWRSAKAYASHQDVVFALARGEVEAGLTTRAWALRLGLPFRAFASEPYALLLYAGDLERAEVRRLRSLLGSRSLREALGAAGYDARRAGEVAA